jgi:pyruvate/2-oxoglutarate dehydrogenase complex dihydrolipoamide dehydrogenase (E3) component
VRLVKIAGTAAKTAGNKTAGNKTAGVARGGGMELITPDICVIGAGPGGLAVAVGAAGFGVPVVLIEAGAIGGGTAAAVAAAALSAAARRAHLVDTAPAFGVSAALVGTDFARVRTHALGVLAAIAPNASRERFTALGIRMIAGTARFTDPATVAVGDEIAIKARRFVIATGSSPVLPPIAGLATTAHLTPETVFELSVCPEHLIVLGAGPTGLELAQAFRRLGAKVTVLDAGDVLPGEDPECAAIVLDGFAREGIVVRGGVAITRVARTVQVQVVVTGPAGEETITGSHLLVAPGRRANLDGLGLDRAGITCDPNGIVGGKGLKTTNKRVYAIGDAAGGPHSVQAATHHAELVIRNALFRLPVRADPRLIPRLTHTDPELAHVGMTEAEARQGRRAINVLRWPYRENDRAQAERAVEGHIKVVTSRKGRILGVTIVGEGAGELITAWTLAVGRGLDIRAMAGIAVPYPTLGEIGKRAAATYLIPGLTSPGARRILAALRRFG